MKYLLLFTLALLSISSAGQSEKPRYGLLWEVTGDALKDTSYIFGSIHLNAPRAFEFSDSLYYAFESTDAFANELNLDSISSYLISDFINSNEDTTSTDDSSSHSMDPDGLPTILDAYLYQAAKYRKKKIYGLESFDDQSKHIEKYDQNFKEEDYEYGTALYEYWVKLYQSANYDTLVSKFMDADGDIDSIMIKRNYIQAEKFLQIGHKETVFATVGTAHLYGKENIIEILRQKGLNVRRVNYGKKTNQINQIYDNPPASSATIDSLDVMDGCFRIYAPSKLHKFENADGNSLVISAELGLGILRFDAATPTLASTPEELDQYVIHFAPDKKKLNLLSESISGDTISRTYNYRSDHLNMDMRITQIRRISLMQICYFLSPSATKTIPADQLYHDFTCLRTENRFKSHFDLRDLGIDYRFLDGAQLQVLSMPYENDSSNGLASIRYKAIQDPITSTEYMIKIQQLPAGYLYTNHHTALDASISQHVQMLGCTTISDSIFVKDGVYHSHSTSVSDNNALDLLHCQSLIYGNTLIILIQKGKEEKNTDFFSSLQVRPPDPKLPEAYKFPEIGLTLNIGVAPFTNTDDDNRYYYFLDSSYLSNHVVTVHNMSPYHHYTYTQDSFDLDRSTLNTLSDSLYHCEPLYVSGKLVGVHSIFTQDSASHLSSHIRVIYDNFDVHVASYLSDERGIELAKSMSNQMVIDPGFTIHSAPPSNSQKLLTDLLSKDQKTFNNASANLYEVVYTKEDTALIMKVLSSELLDSDSLYGVQYQLISAAHDIDLSPSAYQWILESINDESKESRMIESLLVKYDSIYAHLAVEFLTKSTTTLVGGYAFEVFKDSIEIFLPQKPYLKQIADSGRYQNEITSVYLTHYDAQNITSVTDSTWIADNMKMAIDSLTSTTPEDSVFVSESIYEYLLHPDFTDKFSLVEWLHTSPLLYNKWLLTSYLLDNNGSAPSQLIGTLCSDDLYYEAILAKLQERQLLDLLPESYRSTTKSAIASCKNYYQNNYDIRCDGCEVIGSQMINIEDQLEEMLFVRCQHENEFVLSLVGPYAEGVLDLADEKSVFLNRTYQLADENEAKKELLDVYKN